MRALKIYLLIIIFLYGSFVLVEAGVSDIQGKNPDHRALGLYVEEGIVCIIFAGDLYEIDAEHIYNNIADFMESNLNRLR